MPILPLNDLKRNKYVWPSEDGGMPLDMIGTAHLLGRHIMCKDIRGLPRNVVIDSLWGPTTYEIRHAVLEELERLGPHTKGISPSELG